MNPVWYYILFAVGLALVIYCSNIFVKSAIWVAESFNIPQIIIGATLVSACTTLPEAVISIVSSAKGLSNMAFGNAAGSISFNTGFILALIFIAVAPVIENRKSTIKNTLLLLGLILFLLLSVSISGKIGRLMGLVLLILLVLYLIYNTKECINCERPNNNQEKIRKRSILHNFILIILSCAGVVFGSKILVENGENIAHTLGVSEMVIGLTFTAVGSSMPEFATAIAAISNKAGNIAVGNIIGADILNILLVVGASAFVSPISVDRVDFIFHILSLFILVLPIIFATIFRKRNFGRTDGLLLLSIYALYMYYSIKYFS